MADVMMMTTLPKPKTPISDYDNVNFDEIELPEGMSFGIPSDDEEMEAAENAEMEAIRKEEGYACIIVVKNLPVVPPEKFDKLSNVIRKIAGQVGTIREDGLVMPIDEKTNITKGFVFIEFMTEKEAKVAREKLDGYKLDKSHIFKVLTFDEVKRILDMSDEFKPPPRIEYKQHEGLLSWLTDNRGRDQFIIRYQDQSEIYWNDSKLGKCDEVYSRSFWTESFVQWSPRGAMLATVHRQGAAVWGGPEFGRLQRFSHPFVRLISFSPGEKYLVTYSSQESKKTGTTVTLCIFDVKTGEKLRTFVAPFEEFSVTPASSGIQWPLLKWAGNGEDKFFAKIMKNTISVYEAPQMHLLDKKSIKLENVQDFSWSPSDNMFAAYQGERGNQPARVTVIEVPSKQELRQKNLFNVNDVKLYWHPQGEYLAAKVDRHTKSKKTIYTGFEIFSTKEKDLPMDVLELENKTEKIVAFAWEPHGNRFAMVHGETSRPDVSFYTMRDKNGKMKHVSTLKNKPANCLFWSPAGRFIVFGGLKGLNGQLEFFDADEGTTMGTAEHFMCTDVEWDPTGRYIATSVTSVHQMENGFSVWDFKGRMLYRMPRDRFFQFLWRPRHPSLLSKEKQSEILKNLKKYQKRYDEEDEARREARDSEFLTKRRATLEAWQKWYSKKQEELAAEREEYEKLIGGPIVEREFDLEMVKVEEFIDAKEEIVDESDV